MNTISCRAGAVPRASPRLTALVTFALLALAPVGILMSQESPKPAPPAPTQPAAKKTETPAAKPAAQAGTPAGSAAGKTTPAPAAKTTPAEAAKPAGTAAEPESDAGAVDESQAPKRFIPSQKSSADNSATFPIDI